MSHTPGPWRAVEWSDGMRVLMPSGVHVCADIGNPGNAEAQANARLIAASPDLLAALKALRGDSWRHTVDWGPRDERHAIEEQCDAAIAKAEGTAVPVEGNAR